MAQAWTPELEREFSRKMVEDARNSNRRIFIVTIPFFASFAVIDWFVHPPGVREKTFVIRVVSVAALLLLQLRSRRSSRSFAIPAGIVLIIALSVSAMAYVAGGYRTPYFFGVGILLLGASLFFPWGPKRMALASVAVCGLFWGTLFVQAGFRIEDAARWIDITAHLFSMSVIATAAAWIADQTRREAFLQMTDAARSRRRIEDTAEILRSGLHVEGGDVVSLSRKLASRQEELQDEIRAERTERDEALRALEARDEFISIASHELNTPITVLKLDAAILRKTLERERNLPTEASVNAMRRFLDRNEGQIGRLVRLVGEMLDLSRIAAGTLAFQPERFDFSSAVHDLLDRFAPQLAAAGMEIREEIQPDVFGSWDRLRIEQVVSNLFSNAIRYAPRAPVAVVLVADQGTTTLEIRDRGPGIPVSRRESIFDRYDRGEAKSVLGGLGLGLYISRQIIRGHGGEITVHETPGRGATFRIVLPRIASMTSFASGTEPRRDSSPTLGT